MKSSDQSNKDARLFVKDLLINGGMLATLTACAYLFALMYEIGYLNFFGLNYSTARVNTETLVIFGLLAIFAVIALLPYRVLIQEIFIPKIFPESAVWRYILWRLRYVGLLLLFTFTIGLYYGVEFRLLVIILSLLIFNVLWELFIDGRGEKGIKFRAEKALNTNNPPKSTQEERPYALALIFVVLLCFLSLVIGKTTASMESTFKVYNKQYIVVREYGDTIILAKFNPLTHRLTRDYKYTDMSGLVFSIKNIDHLK